MVAAGYDSVPFDVGVEVLRQELAKANTIWKSTVRDGGNPPSTTTHITSLVTMCHGWASGGTVASAVGAMQQAFAAVMAGKLTFAETQDPYMLVPEVSLYDKQTENCVRADSEATGWGSFPRWDVDVRNVGIPHFMAYINSRVIRRSQYLLRPSERFSYKEGMSLWALVDAMKWCVPYVWRGDVKMNPAAGDGPNERMRDEGGFEIMMVGSMKDSLDSKKVVKEQIELKVTGRGDPGYRHTSKILAQVGVCLASNDCHNKDVVKKGLNGGVMTVSSAVDLKSFRKRLEEAKVGGESLLKYEVVGGGIGGGPTTEL